MTKAEYLRGRLLLAMPGMGDPRFERAVVAMCMHDANGAFGIGIGEARPGVTLHNLLAELEIEPGHAPDCAVLNGGPVEPQRGFVLHSQEWEGEGTVKVESQFAISASLEILRAIAEGTGPEHWIVALGYAGWGAGQLDGEMQRHGWFAARGNDRVLFETPVKARWAAAWKAEGIDPASLANVTGRA
jgi:putative transcriptional regulator